MFRKLTGVAIAAALAAAMLLSGCGAPKQDYNLTIMGYDSNLSNVYMQRIFDAYEKKTGNKLNIIRVANGDIDKEVAKSLDEGKAPDILMHFNNASLAKIGTADHFQPLQNEKWVSDIEDSALEYAKDLDGNLYGLPFWESSISGCYYNKTLFNKLGLKPATSLVEFEQLCDALKMAGKTPLVWGDEGCSANYQFGLDPIFADDPKLLDRFNKGEVTLKEIPKAVAMVEWLKKANDKGWFGETTSVDYSDLDKPVAAGDAGMIFIWDTWFDTDFAANKFSKDDFALMPIFMGSADKGTFEGGNLNMMLVNKDSANKAKALDFLSFCADPENYNAAFDGVATNNVFKGQTTNVRSPMVTDVETIVEELVRPSTAQPKISGYDQNKISEPFAKMFRGKLTPEECLDELQSIIDSNR